MLSSLRAVDNTATAVVVAATLLFSANSIAQSSNAATLNGKCPEIPVAIDIGHSILKPGTRSARGVPEYAFNQRLADTIIDQVQARFSNIRAFIINPTGQNISLRQRVKRSVLAGAKVFISVHHDSAQKQYLQRWTYKGKTLDHLPSIRGFSVFISPQEKYGRGRELAELIATGLLGAGRRPSDHHAENIPGERRLLLDRGLGIYAAPFRVLTASGIPAVLVEFGVIRNRYEETELAQKATRVKMANAVLEGIVQFCHNRTAGCGCV